MERVELRTRRLGELKVSPSPGQERRSRLSSPLLQRRQTGCNSPVSQRRSLEVASPQVPDIFSTNSLQRRKLTLQQPHHSPQLTRRSVPLEHGSPFLHRRLMVDTHRSAAVLASLDKSILQIR